MRSDPRTLLPLTACLAALSLGATACDDEGRDTGGYSTTPTATQTAPASTATTPPATATTPARGRRPVTIAATEFRFSPPDVDVRAGRTTFVLRNQGAAPHALEVEGQGIEEETAAIGGGETARLTVDLKPGRYVIYCPVGDHRAQGMEGILTVT
jgi:plastocyanin